MNLRGAVYGITAAAIWGGMYVVSDVVLKIIPPFTLLTIRLSLGLAVLAIFYFRSDAPRPDRAGMLRLLAVGLVGFGLGVGFQFVGTDKSTAVNGALITSASPAFIVIFAAMLLRERLTPRRGGAVLLATIGVVLIVNPAQADFSSQTFFGDMVLVLAAIFWALYSVLVRRVSTDFDTLTITFFAFLGGMILTIPTAAIELNVREIGTITPGIIVGILYLGIISTAVAMWLWNRAFALVDASVAALFFFAQPVVGTALGVVFLNQPMTPSLWAGGVLIGVGVLIAAR